MCQRLASAFGRWETTIVPRRHRVRCLLLFLCWIVSLAAERLWAGNEGLWVGVAGNARVFSADARQWTGSDVPADESLSPNFHDVAWGLTRFVAVGESGGAARLCTSADGRVWRNLPTAALGRLAAGYAVAFGAGRFVVVTGRELLVSQDGETFTRGASLPGELPLRPSHIACGDTEAGFCFVIIGNGGQSRRGDGKRGWRAVTGDGTSLEHFNGQMRNARSVAYGAGHFVAVGAEFIESSHDGQNWAAHPAPGDQLDSVVWTGRRFLVSGLDVLWESSDGLSWKRTPEPSLPDVIWAGEEPVPLQLALGAAGELVFSSDLKAWKPAQSAPRGLRAITFGPARQVGGPARARGQK